MRFGELDSRAHARRAAAWLLFPTMPLIRAALAIAPLHWRTEMLLSDVFTYFAPMLMCIVLAAFLAWRVSLDRSERVFWALLGVAISAVLVSEAHWTYVVVFGDGFAPLFSSWERFLHLFALSTMFVLLIRMTRFGLLPLWKRLSLYLDVLAVGCVAWPVVYLFWTLPVAGDIARGGSTVAALAAAYSIAGAAMILFTTLVIFAAAGRSRAVWERLTAAALWLYGLSLACWPVFLEGQLVNPVESSSWMTLAYGFGFLALVVAMVYRATSGRVGLSPEPWPLPRFMSPHSLRYYPVLTAFAIPLMGAFAIGFPDEPGSGAVLAAMWTLAGILTLRSWIASVERARIRKSLVTDPETGLLTRQILDRRLVEVVEHSGEAGRESSVIVFDARPLQPAFPAGSDGTVEFAHLLEDMRPEGCEAFHVAGERFAIILEDAGPAEAAELATRVWLAASRSASMLATPRVSVYAGVAGFPVHALEAEMLLAAAEVAVSAAHGVEGEAVVIYGDEVASIPPEEHVARERMRIQRATVRALAQAVDARDAATRDHSSNVADLATALAQVIGLPDHMVQIIGLGALMHDVGKIGVRDEVLRKPDRLDAGERKQIEEHCVLGERIIAPARLDEVLPLVRWHHERWDGKGYPDGLSGDEIPIEARVVSVCDCFESMTAERPYAPAIPVAEALEEIEACAGTQFDPEIAGAFVRMITGMMAKTGPAGARKESLGPLADGASDSPS